MGGHHFCNGAVICNRLIHGRIRKLIEVAGLRIAATAALYVVANAVLIGIGRAIATAYAQGVELVAIAIAIASRLLITSAIVNRARTIANAACIQSADAVIHIVAHAIAVGIGCATSAAHAQGIQYVSIAITCAIRKVIASAIPGCARPIANAAFIHCAHTVVHVVAHAIAVGIGSTITATNAQCVRLVAIAVTVTGRLLVATAIVDRARAVAHATSVKLAYAVIHVVTNAIAIGVSFTIAAASAQGVIVQTVVTSTSRWTANAHANGQGQQHEIDIVALRENLCVDCTRQLTIGGELADQNASVRVGKAIGIAIQDVPYSADLIVDFNVSPWSTEAGFELKRPILVG